VRRESYHNNNKAVRSARRREARSRESLGGVKNRFVLAPRSMRATFSTAPWQARHSCSRQHHVSRLVGEHARPTADWRRLHCVSALSRHPLRPSVSPDLLCTGGKETRARLLARWHASTATADPCAHRASLRRPQQHGHNGRRAPSRLVCVRVVRAGAPRWLRVRPVQAPRGLRVCQVQAPRRLLLRRVRRRAHPPAPRAQAPQGRRGSG
jgi:hypothetical protein